MTASGDAEDGSSSARKLDGYDERAPSSHLRSVSETGQAGVSASLMISLSLPALWISSHCEVLALPDYIILGLVSLAIVWAHLSCDAFLQPFLPCLAMPSDTPTSVDLHILFLSGALDALILIAVNWGGCAQLNPWLFIVPMVCITGDGMTWCLVVLLAVSTESILCTGLVEVTLSKNLPSS